jgi:hypothetical protein
LQGEPLRAGLPRPASTLYQYYEQQLTRALPPFRSMQALLLTLGATESTSFE